MPFYFYNLILQFARLKIFWSTLFFLSTISTKNLNINNGNYHIDIWKPLKTPVEHLERQIYL